jgi:hypothetical protein
MVSLGDVMSVKIKHSGYILLIGKFTVVPLLTVRMAARIQGFSD